MDFFQVFAILTALSALFAYLNTRYLKLPFTIGLMLLALIFSGMLILLGQFFPIILEDANLILGEVDFSSLLLEVMLSFLLFAGALHTKLDALKSNRGPIIMLATWGVLISALLTATFIYYLFIAFSYPVDFIYCLLFGALVAPTDPIAVMGILKQAGAPKKLEVKIVGESLFNDGVGVVVFLVLLGIARGGAEMTGGDIALLFLEEVGGGLVLGLAGGYLAYLLMRTIDHYETEIILTLALVMGLYSLASALHFSGPLAVVAAGLLIGNKSRDHAWSQETQNYIDKFWELLDVFLNAILFVLIGLELIIIEAKPFYITMGLLVIPVALIARYLAVLLPVEIFSKRLSFVPRTSLLLTWGGIRGGISLALALSLDADMHRSLFLTMAYILIIFSIAVQGLSLGKVVQKMLPPEMRSEV